MLYDFTGFTFENARSARIIDIQFASDGMKLFLYIQGGPERMQQLWLLISWTSSMKQILVEHSFSNKMTPWSLVLGKVSGLKRYFGEAL